jgi:hypothetical protein
LKPLTPAPPCAGPSERADEDLDGAKGTTMARARRRRKGQTEKQRKASLRNLREARKAQKRGARSSRPRARGRGGRGAGKVTVLMVEGNPEQVAGVVRAAGRTLGRRSARVAGKKLRPRKPRRKTKRRR